jgi:hypothetical protein
MTKQEFLSQRQAQREAGILPTFKPIKVVENFLTYTEERDILQALGNQKAGVYRTSDLYLKNLLVMVEYTGKVVKVIRRKVDEIDNVTVQRI